MSCKLPNRIQVQYIDTYERATVLEACFAFNHLYMNDGVKVAIVVQWYGNNAVKSYGVVGREIPSHELAPGMRYSTLQGNLLAVSQASAATEGCRFVIPEIFPERFRADDGIDVLMLTPQDAVYPDSQSLKQAVAGLLRRYHQALKANNPA